MCWGPGTPNELFMCLGRSQVCLRARALASRRLHFYCILMCTPHFARCECAEFSVLCERAAMSYAFACRTPRVHTAQRARLFLGVCKLFVIVTQARRASRRRHQMRSKQMMARAQRNRNTQNPITGNENAFPHGCARVCRLKYRFLGRPRRCARKPTLS